MLRRLKGDCGESVFEKMKGWLSIKVLKGHFYLVSLLFGFPSGHALSFFKNLFLTLRTPRKMT